MVKIYKQIRRMEARVNSDNEEVVEAKELKKTQFTVEYG